MYLGKKGAIPKKTTRKRVSEDIDRRASGLKESEIQKQCEDYLDYKRVKYIRIPDALYKWIFSSSSRVPPQIKALISSFVKGVPDLVLLFRSGRYACVELKTTTGKLSQGQKSFRSAVGEDNYHVIRSVEGLIELVEIYEKRGN